LTDGKRQQQLGKAAARHGRTYVSDSFDRKQDLCKAAAATPRPKAAAGPRRSVSIVLGSDISFSCMSIY
jgi:hypothetical protein